MDRLLKIARISPVAKQIMKNTERQLKSLPSSDELKLYSRRAIYKINKAEEILGFKPKVGLNEGISMTSKWIHQQGFLLLKEYG